ncbi:MFS transporter [Limosilactobacillus fermentum]|nr:MFS transporter [Limosilactobacillus fermentum]
MSRQVKTEIAGIAGLAFCGILVETSMNVTFPTLMGLFHTTLNNVQWITSAYLLAVTLTIVLAAYLQRSFHYRTILTVSVLASFFGGVICAAALNLPMILLGRVIQGAGTGMALPLLFTIIMTQVPRQQQGTYVGTAGMIIALAPSLGPTYGGTVLDLLDWRYNFIFTLPLIAIFGWVAIKNAIKNQPERHRFQLAEYLAIVVSLVALTLAVNQLDAGLGDPLVSGGLLLFLAALVAFVVLTRRAGGHHLLNLRILTNLAFTYSLLIYVFLQLVQISLTFVIPNLAQLTFNQSALVAGFLLLAGSLLSSFLGPVMGRLLDDRGPRFPLIAGSLCIMASLILFTVFIAHLTILTIIAFHVLYMLGFSMMYNNTMTLGLQQLNGPQIGDGNALFNMLQQYAGSIGIAAMAVIIAIGGAGIQNGATAVLSGSRLAFIVLFCFTVAIALLAFALLASLKRQPSGR